MKHVQLINMAQVLGYSVSNAGLCQGYSLMWAQAVCAGDLSNFENRYKMLEKYATDPTRLLSRVFSVREKAKNSQNTLTEEEKMLLEVPAFFEGIAAYLEPYRLSEISPVELSQRDSLAIAKYFSSMALEKTGFHRPLNMVNQYNLKSCTAFLEKLNQVLLNAQDTAIVLSASAHAISIRSVGPDQFELVDTNHLDLTDKKFTAKALARQLQDSFSWTQGSLIMATEIYTPRHSKVSEQHLEVLEDKTDLTELLPEGKMGSLVHVAALMNDLKTLARIVRSNIDINTPAAGGHSALSMACLPGSRDALEFLLSSNKLNASSLRYALSYCATEHTLDSAKRILDYAEKHNINLMSGSPSPLHDACRAGDLKMVELLISRGADINMRSPQGDHLLLSAAAGKSVALVDYLLKKGLDINEQSVNGITALHDACKRNNTMAHFLLGQGASCNIRDHNQSLPLTNACQLYRIELIPLLLSKTSISMDDIKSDAHLMKIIPVCDPGLQREILVRSLKCYLEHRQHAPEYLSVIGGFFNAPDKKQKMDAAQALLDNLEGIPTLLAEHQNALNDHRLGEFYKLYKTLVKILEENLSGDHDSTIRKKF